METELESELLSTSKNEFTELHQLLKQILAFIDNHPIQLIGKDLIKKYSHLIMKLKKNPQYGSLTDNLLFKHLPMNLKEICYTYKVIVLIVYYKKSVSKFHVKTSVITHLLHSPKSPQLINALVENNKKQPSQLLCQYIHHHAIPAIFSKKYNHNVLHQFSDLITVFPMGFTYKFLGTSEIKAFTEIVETQIPQLYSEEGLIEDWGTRCSTLIYYFGEILHNYNHSKLTTAILNVIETGFRSESVEDQLMAYDCWKTLILNYSLNEALFNSPGQLSFLLSPLVAKLAMNPTVAGRRFDACLYFMKFVKEPNGILPELLDTIFGPFDKPVLRYKHQTNSILHIRESFELWLRINQFFVEITTRIKNSGNLRNADKLIECARVCTYLNSFYAQNIKRRKQSIDMNREVWNQMMSTLAIDEKFLNNSVGRVAEIVEELFSPKNSLMIDKGIQLTVIQPAFFHFKMVWKFASKELEHFATTLTRLVILNCESKILFGLSDLLTNDWLKLNNAEALADFLLENPNFFYLPNVCRYVAENIEGSKKDQFVKNWLLVHHFSDNIKKIKLYAANFAMDGVEMLKHISDLVEKDSNNILRSIKFCCLHFSNAKNNAILYNNLITLLAVLFSDRNLSKVPIELIKEAAKKMPFIVLLNSRRLITDNTRDEDLYFCIATLIDKLKQTELITVFLKVSPDIENLKPLTPVLCTALTNVRKLQFEARNWNDKLMIANQANEILRKFSCSEHDGRSLQDASPTKICLKTPQRIEPLGNCLNNIAPVQRATTPTQNLDTLSPTDSAQSISEIVSADNSLDDNATDEIIQLKETNTDESNNKTVDEQHKPDSININIDIDEESIYSYCIIPVRIPHTSEVSHFEVNNEDESSKKTYVKSKTADSTVNHNHLEVMESAETIGPKNTSQIACDSLGEELTQKRRRESPRDALKMFNPSHRKTLNKPAGNINHNKDSETNTSHTHEAKTELLRRLGLTEVKSDKLSCNKKSPSLNQPNASPKKSVPREDTMTLDMINNANVTDEDTESFLSNEATLNLLLSSNSSFCPENTESKSSIVCNRITSETSKKCTQFIQDSTNISPIVKDKVGNCDPKIDSATVNESGLRRSTRRAAKVHKFFSSVNRSSPISRGKKLTQTLDSPQTSRSRHLNLTCAEDKKSNSETCAKSHTQDTLTFNREVASPLAAPKIGVLKRKVKVLDVTIFPCAKQKGDNLSNSPATSEQTCPKRKFETSEQSPIRTNVECAEEDQTESSNEKNSTSAIDLLQNEKIIRESTADRNVADLEKQIRMDILTKNLLALKACTSSVFEYYAIIRKCFDPSDVEVILNS